MKKIILFLLILFALVLGRGFYFLTYSSGPFAEKAVIEVEPGMTLNQIINFLDREEFILSKLEFKILTKITFRNKNLKIGEYEINRSLNPGQILNILTSGKSISRSITFPEGYNMYEIASHLEEKGFVKKEEFLKLCKDKQMVSNLLNKNYTSLEGYLFPDTYQFTKYEKPKKIITQMVNRFKKAFKKIKTTHSLQVHARVLPTQHSIITLASIIEKETGAPEERPIISSVFHNRLKKRMRLQTDPTVIYGILNQTGVQTKNIRKKDLNRKNIYNTYTFRGLPAGPIANPGFESIKAALTPNKTDFLYFVSKNQGTHVFTTNYKDHARAVRKFQLNRKARQGKSWRDLKNSK